MSLTKQTFREKVKLCWYELLYMFHLLSVVLCASVLGCATCYAAGSATANEVALKGGMSLIDGTWLNQMLTGIAAIIGAVGGIVATLTYCNRRAAKEKAKRPVDSDDRYVTQLECRNHRCALEKRIDELGPALERIFKKLTDNDKRSEERANQMHRRVDPLIEKLSETRGEVSVLKDRIREASAAATIGGTK